MSEISDTADNHGLGDGSLTGISVAVEEALRESEEKYRTILESIQEGYYEVDLAGNLTFVNKAICRILGYTEQELLGLNYRSYYRQSAVPRVRAIFEKVYQTGEPVSLQDWEVVRKDGSSAFLGVSIMLIQDRDGRPIGFRGIGRDMSERIRAEQALLDSEERYRELFENANDIVYTHDLTGRFTSLNKAGELISGYMREEALQKNIKDILPREYHELAALMVSRKLTGDDPTRYELEFMAKDGRRIPVEVSTRVIYKNSKPIGIQGIARDVSERKKGEEERRRLEAQLQHAQKLEGLGVLAGGIAHDFNNLLVGVLGYAGLALLKLPLGSPARGYVEQIEITAKRAAELTNQMLAYSGKGTFSVRPIDINELAAEMGRLLSSSISKKVQLNYDCAPGLPSITGDAAQLHQVIMNLITNASDAIGDNLGVITLRTHAIRADRAYLASTYLNDNLSEGTYVCLEVSDTGCGMDAETQTKIFDPFFSTKFAGRGLGLAAVLGIVRGHQGAIKTYSEVGHGTTFKVLFPAAAYGETRAEELASIGWAKEEAMDWQGTGTVLVADDEENARQVAKEAFEMHGLEVLLATNGREAVEIFKENRDRIKAILLDLMMPVMNGDEALKQIHELEPDVPVVLSSGYTEQDATRQFAAKGPAAFVQKPYVVQELTRKFRMVLDA